VVSSVYTRAHERIPSAGIPTAWFCVDVRTKRWASRQCVQLAELRQALRLTEEAAAAAAWYD
jgi:hypothetical protein